MVQIRVIHASRLLAIMAAAVLAIALALLLIGSASNAARGASTEKAAQVVAAFSLWTPPPIEFEFLTEAPSTPSPQKSEGLVRRVLIYHTHTHEAYQQAEGELYEEAQAWRTADQTHSVVRVGEVLAALLESYGFEVVHDAADYETPQLSTAYGRSLQMLKQRRGEAFDLCLDLHRDAWDESREEAVWIGSERAAQLMILLGDGEGFDEKPDYEANLAFAVRLTDRLNQLAEGVCRPVMTRSGRRYNQQIFTPSLIVEVGHNLNTLQEALSSMPVLAQALFETMNEAT